MQLALLIILFVLLALLKQQGVGLKGMTKSTPVNEEVPPLLEGGGKMEVQPIIFKQCLSKCFSVITLLITIHSGIFNFIQVWRINGSAKTPLPKEDIGKFYSGDCYIILYTYHSGDRKEDYFLCSWFGKDSIEVITLFVFQNKIARKVSFNQYYTYIHISYARFLLVLLHSSCV